MRPCAIKGCEPRQILDVPQVNLALFVPKATNLNTTTSKLTLFIGVGIGIEKPWTSTSVP